MKKLFTLTLLTIFCMQMNCPVFAHGDEELEFFVPIILTALREGKSTQIYFNNHPNGHGARNAKKLRELVEF